MAKHFTGPVQVFDDDQFTSGGDSTPVTDVGALAITNDGRKFRYCFVTPTATVAGQLFQGPAQVTNHQNLTPSAASIGDTSLTVTLGGTLAHRNQYAGGFAVVTVTPGVGYSYRIKSHPAAAASASLVLTLDDPIEIALTGTSRIDLMQNPFSGIIVSPTTMTGPAVGVATDIISAGNYGWIQSGGPVGVLADGAVTIGQSVASSGAVAGAVTNIIATARAIVGHSVTGIADTEYGSIYLTID